MLHRELLVGLGREAEGLVLLEEVPLLLEEEGLLRALGIRRRGPGAAARVRADLEQARRDLLDVARPQALVRRLPLLEAGPSGLLLEGGYRFGDTRLASLYRGASFLNVGITTLGRGVEERLVGLSKSGMVLEAYFFDAVASAGVEEVVSYVKALLCQAAEARGLETTPSFGPGYKYWDIADQRVIFDILPAERLGVILTDSCIMVPRKSASFAVGEGKVLRLKEDGRSVCRFCHRLDCFARHE